MKMKPNRFVSSLVLGVLMFALCLACTGAITGEAKISFEKMTNRDYSGMTYYTIQNVSLFECLGWCKEETSCTSAVFSFVVNPFAALQETTCMLQNETQSRQTAYLKMMPNGDQATVVAHPQKANNLYFFTKIELQTDNVCSRLWAFERFPNKKLRQRDRQPIHAGTKEACQAACMNEARFVCRSIEYNYINQQCILSQHDRRSPMVLQLSSGGHPGAGELIEAPGTDYFENACLLGEDICNESRIYDYAKVGLPLSKVAHFVELNFYPDKEMLVKSQAGCLRACTIEHEFICRSILYRSTFKQGQPNCALYHLDQRTFPDGADTFMSHVMQPLLDSGETSAAYLEAVCNDSIASASSSMTTSITMPPSSITILPSSTTPGGISVHPSSSSSSSIHHLNLTDDRILASTSTLSPMGSSLGPVPTTIRLPSSSFMPPGSNGGITIPSNIQVSDLPQHGRIPSHFTIGPQRPTSGHTVSIHSQDRGSGGGMIPQHVLISPAPPPYPGDPTSTIATLTTSSSSSGLGSSDQNCDAHGFCYDVSLKCTDTKMVVNVKTQRPFHGRIYALGRSETCNANIKNQNQFQLDMYLSGQDCNTQSASGTYTNTIVLQHHNVVLTKADKVYHVRCTYETASRNISFGMMPVKDMFEVDVNDRNQETISITASSDAPLPKISILTLDGKDASTVRIGDRLTFKIEIPDNTPYGIFARSCIAMAKDARSTFEIIDENGCPVDHTIFPNFLPSHNGNALESNYEAFRFTESYGVIFQCNVKYCIGKCEPVMCGIGRDSVEAWGRKKRSITELAGGLRNESSSVPSKMLSDDMTLSREIVVLDLKEGKDPQSDSTSSLNDASNELDLRDGELAALRSPLTSTNVDSSPVASKHCLSSQSVFVLICSLGLFLILYVCIAAYLFSRRGSKVSTIESVHRQYN